MSQRWTNATAYNVAHDWMRQRTVSHAMSHDSVATAYTVIWPTTSCYTDWSKRDHVMLAIIRRCTLERDRATCTGCGIKKQPPKKNSISRKPCNLNSWNLHHIILRNTTVFSENFFHIIHMKQKLQLSELKKEILQLLTQCHWRRTGLAEIAQSLSGRKSGHRIRLISTLPLDYHVWGAMLDKYQCYVPKPTNISELKTVLKVIWSDLPQGPIDEAVLSFRKRLQACIKAASGHFEHAL